MAERILRKRPSATVHGTWDSNGVYNTRSNNTTNVTSTMTPEEKQSAEHLFAVPSHPKTPINPVRNKGMCEAFETWVVSAYGDAAKTKTITRSKHARIVRVLMGEEAGGADGSKFRFWVKSKGFRLNSPTTDRAASSDHSSEDEGPGPYPVLYVPTTNFNSNKESGSNGAAVWKRVAVVESFFDIIYGVHVEQEARGGKHAGQKRTYRAITEKYAFLPREAVTRFLLQCAECQRRGGPDSPTSANLTNNNHISSTVHSPLSLNGNNNRGLLEDMDFSMPITTTYLKRLRSLGLNVSPPDLDPFSPNLSMDKGSPSSHHDDEDVALGVSPRKSPHLDDSIGSTKVSTDWVGYQQALGLKKMSGLDATVGSTVNNVANALTNGMLLGNGGPKDYSREQMSPVERCDMTMDETSSNGNKDEDDDDDDESEDKIEQHTDPERLKAFNMFVRLFVDENLDRMVPISKQPKEKIQAIIDSCTRQFPDFSERARKRIRTYLKSCRRNKRARDNNGWETTRPTPAHLTSVQAEQILAQACENESQNAKRMRMGLEPVSQPSPMPLIDRPPIDQVSELKIKSEPNHVTSSPSPSSTPITPAHTTSNSLVSSTSAVAASIPLSKSTGGAADYRLQQNGTSTNAALPLSVYAAAAQSPFGPAFQRPPAAAAFPIFPGATAFNSGGGVVNTGPTDLSMKSNKPLLNHKLNTTEIATVRQLITGYRESAAFLLRSADELEQLLLQQQ